MKNNLNNLIIKNKLRVKFKGTFLLLILLGVSLLIVGCSGKSIQIKEKSTLAQASNSFETKTTGSTSSGDVLIELTPHEVSDGKLEVDISINTHSVDLSSFDLTEITVLEYDDKNIKPVSAPSLSGHHNSGTLVFDVNEAVNEFTIKIIDIPAVKERTFSWESK